ncbi:COMPASS (complex proteins associated with Set1p) component [Sporothrix curviconia]|uniref:COMPASS (Complex proteins associated with Set1p) component n=1 Tax=Sporothrix curviconia TaxID=1260050 RepID=A0ABP0BQ53_9PEZI
MPASSAASRASRSPSPLSTSYSQDSLSAEFTGSYFAPVGMPRVSAPAAPASVDSDVHMADDVTDGTADHSAASYRPPRQERLRGERYSSPLSNASTTGTSAAGAAAGANTSSNNKKRSLANLGSASSATKRGGSSSSGGGMAKAKGTATSRGGGSSSNNNGGVARPKKGVAIRKPSKPKNGTGNRRLSKSTLSSPSPRRIKRELDNSDDNDDGGGDDDDGDDDRDNHLEADDEDDDLKDTEDDRSMDGGLNGGIGNGNGTGGSDIGTGMDGNTSDNGPYCICRGPDDHRWMIQCDDCEDWFHGDCVKISKDDGENMMLSYICPNCSIPGRYVTRYRRLCSLPGCRRAARLYGVDGMSPAEAPVLTAASATASHFCSDSHRDQWWDSLLGQLPMDRRSSSSSYGGEGTEATAAAAAEAKLAVDLFTPAQLLAVLAHTDQPGVAQMLLQGLVSEHHQKKLATTADLDRRMTVEERQTTQKSAADRYHLAEQIVMCKKMLQLLDMTKTRSQEAIKAGSAERDSCGYDERLQHVGVQPHFQRFLASPEGVALFRGKKLQAPQFDANGKPIDYSKGGRVKKEDDDDDDDNDDGDREPLKQETAGMCGKRKCKAHASWFSTLARDVRMQMQEFTRQAAALRDNETRISLAAIQRSFVKEHSAYEVRYVGDSDNSLTSLASDSEYDDDDDDDDDGMDDEEDDEEGSDDFREKKEGRKEETETPLSEEAPPPTHHILNEDDDEDMVDLVGYGDDSDDDHDDHGMKNTAIPSYNGGYSRGSLSAVSGSANEALRRNGRSPNTDGTVSD